MLASAFQFDVGSACVPLGDYNADWATWNLGFTNQLESNPVPVNLNSISPQCDDVNGEGVSGQTAETCTDWSNCWEAAVLGPRLHCVCEDGRTSSKYGPILDNPHIKHKIGFECDTVIPATVKVTDYKRSTSGESCSEEAADGYVALDTKELCGAYAEYLAKQHYETHKAYQSGQWPSFVTTLDEITMQNLALAGDEISSSTADQFLHEIKAFASQLLANGATRCSPGLISTILEERYNPEEGSDEEETHINYDSFGKTFMHFKDKNFGFMFLDAGEDSDYAGLTQEQCVQDGHPGCACVKVECVYSEMTYNPLTKACEVPETTTAAPKATTPRPETTTPRPDTTTPDTTTPPSKSSQATKFSTLSLGTAMAAVAACVVSALRAV